MIITVCRPEAKRIEFHFKPESGDAAVPMPSVFITGENLHRLRNGALSIIAFLLARDSICNNLVLEGIKIPAYQASIFQKSFGDFEFYCHPVSLVDEAILPSLPPLTQKIIELSEEPFSTDVALRRCNLGFEVRKRHDGGNAAFQFVSSIPLFSSMACRDPLAVLDAIMAMIGVEIFGAVTIYDPIGRFQKNPAISNIFINSGPSLIREFA